MNARRSFKWAVRLSAVAWLMGLWASPLVQAIPAIPQGANPPLRWFVTSLLSPVIGDHSLAIHPETGYPDIHHRAAETGTLGHIHFAPGGGNCGPGNSWLCESEDVPGEVSGEDSSTAFYSACEYGVVHHFYVLAPASAYGNRFVYPHDCGLPWLSQNIELQSSAAGPAGLSNSLKYDLSGTPHVAYFTYNNATAELRYATQVGTGGDCSGSAQWACQRITAGQASQQSAALSLSSSGSPTIIYRGPSGWLHVAEYVGSGGNCGLGDDSGMWRCFEIDQVGDLGNYIAVHQTLCFIGCPDTTIRIAYLEIVDDDNHVLKFAYNVPSGGNCGGANYGGRWNCIEIETVGGFQTTYLRGVSLAMQDGQPLIAYNDTNDLGHSILKVARPAVTDGNCGPGAPFYTWRCEVVDEGGGRDVGYYAALAVNSDGLAFIAYQDRDTYDLKLAYQAWPIFLPLASR